MSRSTHRQYLRRILNRSSDPGSGQLSYPRARRDGITQNKPTQSRIKDLQSKEGDFAFLQFDRVHSGQTPVPGPLSPPCATAGKGLYGSHEFTVPLCAIHHHGLHRVGQEELWWREQHVDPLSRSPGASGSKAVRSRKGRFPASMTTLLPKAIALDEDRLQNSHRGSLEARAPDPALPDPLTAGWAFSWRRCRTSGRSNSQSSQGCNAIPLEIRIFHT